LPLLPPMLRTKSSRTASAISTTPMDRPGDSIIALLHTIPAHYCGINCSLAGIISLHVTTLLMHKLGGRNYHRTIKEEKECNENGNGTC
jgi:hypothetical protein